MKTELYETVLEALLEKVGFKCQPSELEELAQEIVDKTREILSEELM